MKNKKARLVASGYHLLRTSSMVSKISHVPLDWNQSCDIRSLRRIGSKWRRLFVSPWSLAVTSPLFVLTIVESTSFAILTKNLLACQTMSVALLEAGKRLNNRFCKPPAAATFEPAKMPTESRCTDYCVWIMLNFIKWECFFDSNLLYVRCAMYLGNYGQ